jgi:type VI protein secretion system component Hcp
MAESICILRISGIEGEYVLPPFEGGIQLLSFTAERSAGLNSVHFQMKTGKSTMQIVNAVNAETRLPSATLMVQKAGQTAIQVEFRDLVLSDDHVYGTAAGHPVESYTLTAAAMNVVQQIGPLAYGTFIPGKTYRY